MPLIPAGSSVPAICPKKAPSCFAAMTCAKSFSVLIRPYVRGNVHTNTIEGYFSILKRAIYGTYHHVSQQHLKRYSAEFDFRYNERSALGVEDEERTPEALSGIVGKRLMYLDSSVA